MRSNSFRVALGGLLSAFAVGVMLLGSFIPLATFTAPAVASLAVLYFSVEYGKRFALVIYSGVSALSLLFAADKEPAFLFVLLLGYYPILKGVFEALKSKVICWSLKLILFNSAVLLTYKLLISLTVSESLAREIASYLPIVITLLMLLGNVAFLLYDIALTRLITLYIFRIKPKLKRRR